MGGGHTLETKLRYNKVAILYYLECKQELVFNAKNFIVFLIWSTILMKHYDFILIL